jgi:hypothetical protein
MRVRITVLLRLQVPDVLLCVDPQGGAPQLHPVALPLGVEGEDPEGEACAGGQVLH